MDVYGQLAMPGSYDARTRYDGAVPLVCAGYGMALNS